MLQGTVYCFRETITLSTLYPNEKQHSITLTYYLHRYMNLEKFLTSSELLKVTYYIYLVSLYRVRSKFA